MLNIANFSKPCEDILFYEGENRYSIMKDDCGYTLLVERLVQTGEDDSEIVQDAYACKYDESIASLASILYEAGEELHKAKGGSAYSAAKRLASYIPEYRPGCRAWIDGEGRQCFCSGAFAVRLNTPLEGLPEIPEKVEPINYASLFAPQALPSRDLPLPSLGDLKICMAAQNKPPKGKAKTYDFGDGLPFVDAEILKNLLTLLPGATARNDKELGCIYLSAEAGDAILMPIRKAAYREA